MIFHHFPLKCRFRGPRSADASVATRFLFILGGSGRAIWVKNRKMPSRTTFNEKVGKMTNFSLKGGSGGHFPVFDPKGPPKTPKKRHAAGGFAPRGPKSIILSKKGRNGSKCVKVG